MLDLPRAPPRPAQAARRRPGRRHAQGAGERGRAQAHQAARAVPAGPPGRAPVPDHRPAVLLGAARGGVGREEAARGRARSSRPCIGRAATRPTTSTPSCSRTAPTPPSSRSAPPACPRRSSCRPSDVNLVTPAGIGQALQRAAPRRRQGHPRHRARDRSSATPQGLTLQPGTQNQVKGTEHARVRRLGEEQRQVHRGRRERPAQAQARRLGAEADREDGARSPASPRAQTKQVQLRGPVRLDADPARLHGAVHAHRHVR